MLAWSDPKPLPTYYGAYKSQKIKGNLIAVKALWNKLGFIESNEDICETFGKLKADMEKKGNVINDADMFIKRE